MLTEKECRAAQAGPKERKISDSNGLYLSVLPTGSKSWRWKYRFAGREKRLVIGPYPLISLKDARLARDKARAMLTAGEDPGAHKQARRRAVKLGETFEDIARSWHAAKLKTVSPRYAKEVLARLQANAFPQLGAWPIRDITPSNVLEVVRRIEARGAKTMAHEVRGHMSEVFVWAISSGLADADPAAIIRKALLPAAGGRRPALLTIEAARKLLQDIDRVPHAYWSTKLASRMLALTAVRPGVVRMAEIREFEDLDGKAPLWRVPAARMKLTVERKADSAFDFLVPLSRQAVATVKAAISAGGGDPVLFPAERTIRKPMSDSTLSALYRDAGYTGQHVPHGWRASFSTIMNERASELGRDTDRPIIDFMLAHIPGDVEALYNRAAYLPRRRELAQEWADLLLQDALAPSAIRVGPRRKGLTPARESGHEGDAHPGRRVAAQL